MNWLTIFLVALVVPLALAGLVSLGFALRPRPYRPHPVPSHPGDPAPFRPGLPEPVARHFRETIGEQPRQIASAVVWGRGRACIRGIWMPLRFKSWYLPGESFMRRVEVTWFTRPVMRGVETFRDGKGFFELGGSKDEGPHRDFNEQVAMWAETLWLPSVLVQDPRVQWEPVSDTEARLNFQAGTASGSLLASFDPATGRMVSLSGMRMEEEVGDMEPWQLNLLEWKDFHGMLLPYHTSVAWGEGGSPTSYWQIDGVAYNVHIETI